MRSTLKSRTFRMVVAGGIAALGGTAAAAIPASGVATVAAMRLIPASAGHIVAGGLTFPPTTAYCQANLGINCYQPFQMQKAYDLAGAAVRPGHHGQGPHDRHRRRFRIAHHPVRP